MTDIIRFTMPVPQVAEAVIAVFLEQANTWSRLGFLAGQPGYVSQPFGRDTWQTKVSDADTYWADFGTVYTSLGDHGRLIADRFMGMGAGQGILIGTPLFTNLVPGGVVLTRETVQDMVAAGFLAPS